MRKTGLSILSVVLLLGANAAVLNDAQAFNMGNMMNPSRWFDDDDRYDRGYHRGYGPYGGYGYGPYGYGGPYGWGGYPGYGGWGGYPGYGGWGGGYGQGPSTIVVNPSPDSSRQEQAPPAPRLPE